MHYTIIVITIALIVFFQIKIFIETIYKSRILRSIFSDNSRDYELLSKAKMEEINSADDEKLDEMLIEADLDIEKYHYVRYNIETGEIPCFRRKTAENDLKSIYQNRVEIHSSHDNFIFTEIITSINSYLSVNKSGVSDFHLMKDIVERNCDTQEEEINTQIPIPLYLGLVGTMIGILIGIGYLWISGGLSDLLNAGNNSSGAEGVETLLGGVALAMVSSILGILLTTFGSMEAKNTKYKVEKNKHIFLSWIQAKLMPNLSNDTAQTLEKMSQNLVTFNNTFSENTGELGKALSQVNESYQLQAELLDTIKQIADKNISTKNIQLYNTLKNSTEEIGTLASYLNNVNEYLANVKALNEKLDASEQRAKVIEDMVEFFKTEAQQIEARKGAINKAVGTVDNVLQDTLNRLKDHTNEQFVELTKATVKQQDALQQKLEETSVIIAELKNLTAIKDSISNFEQATQTQNDKLDNLTNAIISLTKVKFGSENHLTSPKPKISAIKIGLIWALSVIGGLVILLFIAANWHHISVIFTI